jgi:hypothetical protein
LQTVSYSAVPRFITEPLAVGFIEALEHEHGFAVARLLTVLVKLINFKFQFTFSKLFVQS